MIVVVALAFLALHLPYLPASLEDLDSINFALGVRQFDVAHHQPHPPGYPVYIAIAKGVHAAVPDEARALAIVSVATGCLGLLAIAAFVARLDPDAESGGWVAVALAATAPLYWLTSARPLSDMPGLAAAVAIQAATLSVTSARGLAAASFCAGLASGIRSQVAWLTVPLLFVKGFQRRASNPRSLVPAGLSFLCGIAVWAVPLVAATGGVRGYWHALSDQGAEDLGNIQMLWTRHGVRDVADAFYFAFVAPWAVWPLAVAVLLSALLGLAWLWRNNRAALVALGAAFGPYLAFDMLFQETFTSRYALPLVVPIACLAATGMRWLPRQTIAIVAALLVAVDLRVGGPSLAAYASQKAPAFRLLDDMQRAASATGVRPVLAPDRRQSFDLRRPTLWVGSAMAPIVGQLPAPPQHEWLEAVRYWNGGGRAPVWFVVDPKRAAMDLVQHPAPFQYRWPLPYPVLLSGVRPNEVDWYAVDQPEWYAGEGWALTPESAGVAASDRRGLASGPIEAWIRRRHTGGVLAIGGRSLDPARTPRLTVAVEDGSGDRQTVVDDAVPPGSFLRFAAIPPGPEGDIGRDAAYSRVEVRATGGGSLAIEQFAAAPAGGIVYGFGDGWQEPEFNPTTGARWRWLSERGEIRIGSGPPAAMVLSLDGESPLRYFSRGSRLRIRSGDQLLFDDTLSADFALTVHVPSGADTLVLETDQVYVPAERGWRRSADRRHLGLRIFNVRLR